MAIIWNPINLWTEQFNRNYLEYSIFLDELEEFDQ